MRILKGFDEKALYAIAKECGNEQIKSDIRYMRFVQHTRNNVYCERLEDRAFFVGYHNSDHFRLVGIGVRKDMQGKGYGKFMLCRAISYARAQGYAQIRTRTLSGVDFYQRCAGAKITGMIKDDYLMEIDI